MKIGTKKDLDRFIELYGLDTILRILENHVTGKIQPIHKEQVKENDSLHSVSIRRELLDFLDWHYEDDIADQKTKEIIVDTYLNKS